MAAGTILKNDRRDVPAEGRRSDWLARIFCRCATNRLAAPGHERAQKAERLPPGLHGIRANGSASIMPKVRLMKAPATRNLVARYRGWQSLCIRSGGFTLIELLVV